MALQANIKYLFFISLLFFSCSGDPQVKNLELNESNRSEETMVNSNTTIISEHLNIEDSFNDILYKQKNLLLARHLWETQGPFYIEDLSMQQSVLRILYSSHLRLPEGMGNISVLKVISDDLWVGTWDGAVFRYSLSTEEWDIIEAPIESLNVNTVYSIEEDGGIIWLVHYNRILGYSTNSSTLKPWPSDSIPGRNREKEIWK
nr:hypothetical protein [Spirochaetaceae bacterium]